MIDAGPYRSRERIVGPCLIIGCPACSATVDILCATDVAPEHRERIEGLLHDVQRDAGALSDARATARRELRRAAIEAGLLLALVMLIGVFTLSLRTAPTSRDLAEGQVDQSAQVGSGSGCGCHASKLRTANGGVEW